MATFEDTLNAFVSDETKPQYPIRKDDDFDSKLNSLVADNTQAPQSDFDSKLNSFIADEAKPEYKPQSSLFRRAVSDPLVQVAQGGVNAFESGVGLANLVPPAALAAAIPGMAPLAPLIDKAFPGFGQAGKIFEKITGMTFQDRNDYWNNLLSADQQEANRRVGEADGILNTAVELIKNPSVITGSALQSGPSMVLGGGIGRLGTLAIQSSPKILAKLSPKFAEKLLPVITGGAGEGIQQTGFMSESVREGNEDGLLTPKQVALSVASGLADGVIAVLGGALSQKLGFDDFQTLLAGGRTADGVMKKKNIVARIIGNALMESGTEFAQSAQEKIAENIATDKPWSEGVPNASTIGAATGLPMGALATGMGAVKGDKDNKAPMTLKDSENFLKDVMKVNNGKSLSDLLAPIGVLKKEGEVSEVFKGKTDALSEVMVDENGNPVQTPDIARESVVPAEYNDSGAIDVGSSRGEDMMNASEGMDNREFNPIDVSKLTPESELRISENGAVLAKDANGDEMQVAVPVYTPLEVALNNAGIPLGANGKHNPAVIQFFRDSIKSKWAELGQTGVPDDAAVDKFIVDNAKVIWYAKEKSARDKKVITISDVLKLINNPQEPLTMKKIEDLYDKTMLLKSDELVNMSEQGLKNEQIKLMTLETDATSSNPFTADQAKRLNDVNRMLKIREQQKLQENLPEQETPVKDLPIEKAKIKPKVEQPALPVNKYEARKLPIVKPSETPASAVAEGELPVERKNEQIMPTEETIEKKGTRITLDDGRRGEIISEDEKNMTVEFQDGHTENIPQGTGKRSLAYQIITKNKVDILRKGKYGISVGYYDENGQYNVIFDSARGSEKGADEDFQIAINIAKKKANEKNLAGYTISPTLTGGDSEKFVKLIPEKNKQVEQPALPVGTEAQKLPFPKPPEVVIDLPKQTDNRLISEMIPEMKGKEKPVQGELPAGEEAGKLPIVPKTETQPELPKQSTESKSQRPPDILDWIKGSYPGGVGMMAHQSEEFKSTQKEIPLAYRNLFRKGGAKADEVAHAYALQHGINPANYTPDNLFDDIINATKSRMLEEKQKLAEKQYWEEQEQKHIEMNKKRQEDIRTFAKVAKITDDNLLKELSDLDQQHPDMGIVSVLAEKGEEIASNEYLFDKYMDEVRAVENSYRGQAEHIFSEVKKEIEQTNIDEGGIPFSKELKSIKTEGKSDNSVDFINGMYEKLKTVLPGLPNVEILNNENKLDDNVKKRFDKQSKGDKVHAFWDDKTKKMYFFSDNLMKKDTVSKLLHEVIGHAGMLKAFPDLVNTLHNLNKSDKLYKWFVDGYVGEFYKNKKFEQLTPEEQSESLQEGLARFAESGQFKENHILIRKIRGMIIKVLESIGLGEYAKSLTTLDVMDMIAGSVKVLGGDIKNYEREINKLKKSAEFDRVMNGKKNKDGVIEVFKAETPEESRVAKIVNGDLTDTLDAMPDASASEYHAQYERARQMFGWLFDEQKASEKDKSRPRIIQEVIEPIANEKNAIRKEGIRTMNWLKKKPLKNELILNTAVGKEDYEVKSDERLYAQMNELVKNVGGMDKAIQLSLAKDSGVSDDVAGGILLNAINQYDKMASELKKNGKVAEADKGAFDAYQNEANRLVLAVQDMGTDKGRFISLMGRLQEIADNPIAVERTINHQNRVVKQNFEKREEAVLKIVKQAVAESNSIRGVDAVKDEIRRKLRGDAGLLFSRAKKSGVAEQEFSFAEDIFNLEQETENLPKENTFEELEKERLDKAYKKATELSPELPFDGKAVKADEKSQGMLFSKQSDDEAKILADAKKLIMSKDEEESRDAEKILANKNKKTNPILISQIYLKALNELMNEKGQQSDLDAIYAKNGLDQAKARDAIVRAKGKKFDGQTSFDFAKDIIPKVDFRKRDIKTRKQLRDAIIAVGDAHYRGAISSDQITEIFMEKLNIGRIDDKAKKELIGLAEDLSKFEPNTAEYKNFQQDLHQSIQQVINDRISLDDQITSLFYSAVLSRISTEVVNLGSTGINAIPETLFELIDINPLNQAKTLRNLQSLWKIDEQGFSKGLSEAIHHLKTGKNIIREIEKKVESPNTGKGLFEKEFSILNYSIYVQRLIMAADTLVFKPLQGIKARTVAVDLADKALKRGDITEDKYWDYARQVLYLTDNQKKSAQEQAIREFDRAKEVLLKKRDNLTGKETGEVVSETSKEGIKIRRTWIKRRAWEIEESNRNKISTEHGTIGDRSKEFGLDGTLNGNGTGLVSYLGALAGKATSWKISKDDPLYQQIPSIGVKMGMKNIMMFTRTLANITELTLDYTAGRGFVTPLFPRGMPHALGFDSNAELISYDRKIQRLKHSIAGVAAMGALAALAMGGKKDDGEDFEGFFDVYGSMVDDPERKKKMASMGVYPFSLRFGKLFIPFTNIIPLAGPLAVIGGIRDRQRVGKWKESDMIDKALVPLIEIGRIVTSVGFIKGMNQFVEIFSQSSNSEETKDRGISWAIRSATNVIPGIAKEISGWLTENKADNKDIRSKIMSQVPIAQWKARPAIGYFGAPVKNHPLGYLFVYAKNSDYKYFKLLSEKNVKLNKPGTPEVNGAILKGDDAYNYVIKAGKYSKQMIDAVGFDTIRKLKDDKWSANKNEIKRNENGEILPEYKTTNRADILVDRMIDIARNQAQYEFGDRVPKGEIEMKPAEFDKFIGIYADTVKKNLALYEARVEGWNNTHKKPMDAEQEKEYFQDMLNSSKDASMQKMWLAKSADEREQYLQIQREKLSGKKR